MARFSAYKSLVSPVLFSLDPERVHRAVLGFMPAIPSFGSSPDPILKTSIAGLDFISPVGLAAGFDKDAKCFKHAFRLGFGSVEVGTLTPKPQTGNAGKRIYRLTKDKAVVNRMGFPNCGIDAAIGRISDLTGRTGPLGVNIGANKDSADKIGDYVNGYKSVAPHSDYVAINISSPNTPGLRKFESSSHLKELIDRIDENISCYDTPVFLKVSPDLEDYQIEELCETVVASRISAVIVGNTTIRRPNTLVSKEIPSEGGLSGRPLSPYSFQALLKFREFLGDKVPIVSVGGISSAQDVYARLRAGASLVQLYTSFIYEGPALVAKINKELPFLLRTDGFGSLESVIGVDAPGRPNHNEPTSQIECGAELALAK